MTKILYRVLSLFPRNWILGISKFRGKHHWFKLATDWVGDMVRKQDCRIASGLGKGLKFNSGGSAVGFMLGTHDVDVQFAMDKMIKTNQVVYDLGANVGFTAVLACKCVGEKGKVVCFEPMDHNAKQVQVNAKLNNFSQIEVFQVALGECDGVAEFQTSHSPTWGRLTSAGDTPEQTGVTQVTVRQLDKLVEEKQLPLPNFIKMDVEGAEADVIRGAYGTLSRSRPKMIIELHHTYHQVIESLEGLDYVVNPLVQGGVVQEIDGEYQILAYHKEDAEAEAFWSRVRSGEPLEFA
jgi:FkbM family methyltransferase